MIGILSNKNKMQSDSENFFSMFSSVTDHKAKHKILVFTLSDIDFSDRTVYGNLISKDYMEKCRMPIPDIIFNFSHQQKNSNKKKIKFLAEQDHVLLINEINQFSQNMILEMLSSSPGVKPMLLNYSLYNCENNVNDVLKKDGILILPEKGPGLLNAIWKNKNCRHACHINQDQQLDFVDIFACDGEMSKKNWIIFDAPDLLLQGDQPVIMTLHVQKTAKKTWKVLSDRSGRIIKKVDLAAIEIAKYLSCFLPTLAFCTVTFVVDQNFNPFFINLRGWDPRLLLDHNDHDLHMNFMKNLFSYYDFLKTKQKGGNKFVD